MFMVSDGLAVLTKGNHPTMTILKYDTFEIDTDELPEASVNALLQRGLTHYLGNEQASKVTSWKKSHEDADESAIEAQASEYRTAAYDALLNGTIGTRAGGPKLKGIDRLIHLVAVEQITAFAASQKAKMPSGKGSADKVAAMVDKWLSNESRKAAVVAEAQRRFDAQKDVGDEDFADMFGEAAE